MGRSAAFFDLDRTLLVGASGPVFSAALRDAGVIADRNIPGEKLLEKATDAHRREALQEALASVKGTASAAASAR